MSLHFHGFTFPSALWANFPHQHDGRYGPTSGLGLDLIPTTCTTSVLPPSGKPSHTSPEAHHDVFPFELNHDNHKRSALQNASREPENRAVKQDDSHPFWFLAKNYFLQRNGVL